MYLKEDILTALMGISWLKDLDQVHLMNLAEISEVRRFDCHDYIFHEGDRMDYLYLLLEGKVDLDIFVPSHGRQVFYTSEPIDIVGWDTLTPIVRQRSASALAVTPSTCLAFEGRTLIELCENDHELGYVFMRRLSNVVANRLLTTRLQLFELISAPDVTHAIS